MKLACDNDYPCETCLSHKLDCTRSRTERTPKHAGKDSESPSEFQTEKDQPSQPPNREKGRKTRLPFLLNYARPDNKSLASAFGIASTCGRDVDLNSIGNVRPANSNQGSLADPAIARVNDSGNLTKGHEQLAQSHEIYRSNDLSPFPDFSEYSYTSSFSLVEDLAFWLIPLESDGIEKRSFWSSNLDLIASNLVDELAHWLSSTSIYSYGDTASDVNAAAAALKLFTAQNVQSFIHDYFRRWNHHSPIIHPGTFNAVTASTPLLLAVCLTGACLSSQPDEVSSATLMLDVAEEFVFGHRDFECIMKRSSPSPKANLQKDLSAIQAAFSISQIQLRRGSREKRMSIRTARFDQLIAAVRVTDLLSSSIMDSKSRYSSSENFDWETFGVHEAGKRLVLGIFNLDVSFTLFYDMQPRLLAEEVPFLLTCTVDAYMALEAEACLDTLLNAPHHDMQTLPDVINALCFQDTSLLDPGSLDVLHLFAVILGKSTAQRYSKCAEQSYKGLLQLIWLSPRVPSTERREEKMRKALQQWKRCWDDQTADSSAESKERYGFALHAAIEFWQVANMLMDRDHARAHPTQQPSYKK